LARTVSGAVNNARPHGRDALMGGDPGDIPGPEDRRFRDMDIIYGPCRRASSHSRAATSATRRPFPGS